MTTQVTIRKQDNSTENFNYELFVFPGKDENENIAVAVSEIKQDNPDAVQITFVSEQTGKVLGDIFTSFSAAKEAADNFFNENFNYKNGASYHTDKQTEIKDETGETIGYDAEYHSADDPAMDDTFSCKIIF